MQVPRGRGDVRVTYQSLDNVDVLAPAHEGSGVGVTPTVWVVAAGDARRGPGLEDQSVQRPSPVATAEAPVAAPAPRRSSLPPRCWSDVPTKTRTGFLADARHDYPSGC